MSWHVSSWVYPVWDSLHLLDLIDYFLFHVGQIFNYSLFKNFLLPFLFLFFFWDPYNSNVVAFDIVPEVCETILRFFSTFLCYSDLQKLFPPLYLPAHWFILLLQIFCYWFLLEYFLISVIVLFVSVCLFFNPSRSLLIDSCIFSILFSR